MTEYLTDFVQESEERITELNNALLTLERDPTDDEAMEEIFRVAHTLKGNCGAMGFESASDLAHAIEDLLDAVRGGDLEVTPELMDVIFDAVDELEAMVDEVAADGEVDTDPSATIEALREHLEDGTGDVPATVSPPSTDEIDAILERFDPPADDDHEAYLVRLAVADRDGVNTGKLVVDALIDAFDLIGTDPPRDEIEAGDYGDQFDAVFGSAVGDAAITSGLEPVEEVRDFELVTVSDRFEARSETGDETAESDTDDLSSADAADLEVDELLDEFDEFDDLDAMVEDVDDDELEPFEEMGDAGSFDDLFDDDELETDVEPGEPAVDSLEDVDDGGDDDGGDDEATATAGDPEQAADTEEDVEDANAVFNELKDEVEMVGFDELQDELDELEFDEFDDDEVGMDELIGDAADDDSFLEDEPDDADGTRHDADGTQAEAEPIDAEDTDSIAPEDETASDPADLEGDADPDVSDELAADERESEVAFAADAADDLGDGDAADDLESDVSLESTDEELPSETESDPADDVVAFDAEESVEDDTEDADDGTAAEESPDQTVETDPAPSFEEEVGSRADDDTIADEPTDESDDASVTTNSVDDAFDDADTDDFADEEFGNAELAASDDTFDDTAVEPEESFVDEFDDEAGADEFDADEVSVDEFDADEVTVDEFGDDGMEEATFDADAFDDPFDDDDADDALADDGFDIESSPTTASSTEPSAFDDEAIGTDAEADGDGDEVVTRVDEPTLESPALTIPETVDRSTDDQGSDEIQSVRVDVEQVDSLLTLVEGLVTSRVRLRHAVTETDGAETDALETELDDLGELTSELQETVMDIRLVPLETVTNRLPRIVRDIAREQDKAVAFEMIGEDVELDRSILDRIGDPLIHLVRNAVDHGIEPPETREKADKPREGTVEFRAERERDRVTITVEDDGSGLDPDRLRSEAVEADVLADAEAAELSDEEVYDLIFHPGLSTADEVTDVSGRGVGMDVVKRTIEDLDGTVSIDSDVGEGTSVTMSVPVSVAIDDVLFVECGGEEFGVPTKAVQDIESVDASEAADDAVVRLDEELETPKAGDDDGMLVQIRDDVRPIALYCDHVHGQQEVVVKPFEGFMSGVPGLSGATVRGRGKVVNILDVTTL
ncbi:Hpt domain-containing protein [Natronolimnohabitans sp. A-GB9]|uniref:chemotaxis protein CheA n=1 Tax=Natronolimnohabitans sp. A-GB9 TaxID=3069757 RepID=UPI0027AE7DB2|nr:chemotaxis protein CheA [Natronolimnohabitans sp. A-GB9]MDQ2051383.1 Hpt domain-containing protein [Natronolimnohabitans sp. A-GB9]